MSASVPPVVSTLLPRYVNASTSSRAVQCMRIGLLVLERVFITCIFAVLGVRPMFCCSLRVCPSFPAFVSVCVKGELCHLQSQGHPAALILSTESCFFSLIVSVMIQPVARRNRNGKSRPSLLVAVLPMVACLGHLRNALPIFGAAPPELKSVGHSCL